MALQLDSLRLLSTTTVPLTTHLWLACSIPPAMEGMLLMSGFVFSFSKWFRGKKRLHYLERAVSQQISDEQSVSKNSLCTGDCFVKTFQNQRPVNRTDYFRQLWFLCRFLGQSVKHTITLLFDQRLPLRNVLCSPKALENSFKLLTSSVKNFSVDFKWNANNLTFFQTHFTAMAVYPL